MAAALKNLARYSKYLEKGSSSFKGHGVFYYDYNSLHRPETLRHITQLKENYGQPGGKDILVLVKAPPEMPYNNYGKFQVIKNHVEYVNGITFCFYAAPFGIIPENLAETFPLSQFEIAEPIDKETIEFTIQKTKEYLEKTSWRRVILLREYDEIDFKVEEALMEMALLPEVIQSRSIWEEDTGKELQTILQNK
jgi:7-cyano-7-deazaguanine tRNA-ribosyltransferase